jgi:hypothetical protein
MFSTDGVLIGLFGEQGATIRRHGDLRQPFRHAEHATRMVGSRSKTSRDNIGRLCSLGTRKRIRDTTAFGSGSFVVPSGPGQPTWRPCTHDLHHPVSVPTKILLVPAGIVAHICGVTACNLALRCLSKVRGIPYLYPFDYDGLLSFMC